MERDYVTCHILDTVKGKPAANVKCVLSKLSGGIESVVSSSTTDGDGRIANWGPRVTSIDPGAYKMRFETGEYLSANNNGDAFFPVVEVMFAVSNPPDKHYHIPLLLSNYSYSTYRGS